MSGTGYVALPTPVTANPQFWNQGLDGLNALRDYQAKQATAQIYQQSIDPSTGQIDQGKFNALLAANPRAAWNAGQAMQQQGQAQGAQVTASTNQFGFNHAQQAAIGGALGSMISQPDANQTPNAYTSQLQLLLNSGSIDASHYQLAKNDLDSLGPNPSPQDLRTHASRWLISSLSNGDIAHTALPRTEISKQPQGDVPTVVSPPLVTGAGGGQRLAPGGVQAGVGPGQTQDYMFQPTDANGKPSGAPYKVTAPAGTVFPSIQGTRITPIPAPSGAPPAGPPQPGGSGSAFPPGYTGRGVPPPPNAALTNPNKPAPAPAPTPAPAPAPATPPPSSPAPTAFRYPNGKIGGAPDAQGGVHYADGTYGSPPPGTPVSVAANPPAPAPAPTPAPAPAPTSQPPGGGVAVALPVGTPEAIQTDVSQFKQDQAHLNDWQTTDQNLGHAYEALKLTTSGRSTEATHNMYSFLLAQGALPPGMQDSVTNYDLFKKYTERVIADLGNAAGTDQGRQLAAQSNAGTSFSTAANMEIMRNDIAKNRQKMAITMLEDQNGTGVGYGSRKANLASTTDPRGFAWNLYTPAEQQKILAEVANDKVADAKLHRAIGIADALHLGVTPGQTPAGPRAMLQPNPLIPSTNYAAATPNANALAA